VTWLFVVVVVVALAMAAIRIARLRR